MGLLDDIMADDAAAFINADGFGEAVTYKPAAGGTRSINAVVERNPPEPLPEQPQRSIARHLVVTVANSATTGISAAELVLDGDAITLAARLGQAAADHTIKQVLSADAGVLRLKLQ